MTWNIPNILVILRFFLAFVVISILLSIGIMETNGNTNQNLIVNYANIEVNILNYVALFIFLIAAFTDWLDGYLARKNNQITNFGKIFDPLADKILVNSVLVIFTVFGRIPIFFTILFIIRDLLVDGLRILVASQGKTLAAQKNGKYKTMFQFIGISILFIIYSPQEGVVYNFNNINSLSLIPLSIGLFFSIYSGVEYYLKNLEYIFYKEGNDGKQ